MEEQREPNVGWTEALGEHASNPSNPRTSGEILNLLGRQWKVSSCENRIKTQFEQWVRSNAKKDIAETEQEEGPEEANRARSAYTGDRGAGHYNWDGRHCRNARGDLPGLRHLLFLLLYRCQPDVTESQVEAMFRESPTSCGEAIRWALGNSPTPPASAAPGGGNGSATMVKRDAQMPAKKVMKEPTTMDSP